MAAYDAVIIGGGLGGLLCGNILSKEGMNVCVIDKNHKLGGSLQTFGRKGCIFNTGLNYTESLDEGQVLNRYFRYFGLIDKLKLQRLDPDGFEVISFPDRQYKIAMGRENFIQTLAADFPHERNALEEYCRRIQDICTAIPMYTLTENPVSVLDDRSLATGTADFIRSLISDNRLRQILAGHNMLYAGNEAKTPLYIHALITNSFIESAWRISGGSHHIVNILAESILANGGTIIRNQKVEKLAIKGGKVECIGLSGGEQISGRYFIADIHPDLILDMVEPGIFRKSFANRIRSTDNTMGMFTLYLVFKKNTIPYALHNFHHFNQENVWVASDYSQSRWPQNYLLMHTASPGVDEFAESASVITYMRYGELNTWEHTFTGNRGEEYLAFKENKASRLLEAVEKQFPGLRNHIQAYYTSTPLTWRDYTGTRAGSAYGILKDYNKPLESLVLPRTQIPNLFLTGQNTNVHGILGVTISSFVTCSEIIEMSYLVKRIKNCS